MADHLFLSLKPPPPLNFPCFHRHTWRRSSFSGGIRSPVRDIRLPNSTSPSHSSFSSSPPPLPLDSAPVKFDVISTLQLKDGSHVFRFGDANEIERDLGVEEITSSVGDSVQEEQVEIAEEAGGVVAKEAIEKEDSACLTKSEGPNEKSKSETETVNSNMKTVTQKEDRAAPTNSSNAVIKIKDRKRSRSPSKKKNETSNPVNVFQNDDKVEAKHASMSDLNSEVNSPSAVPEISGEKKVIVSGVSETTNRSEKEAELLSLELTSEPYVHPKVMEKALENEVIVRLSASNFSETRDYPQITEKDRENQTRPELSTSEGCSENHDLQEVAQEKTGIKVVHVSTIVHGDNLDAVENPITDFDHTENDFVELKTTTVVSPDEPISIKGAIHRSVDETDEKSVLDRSDVVISSDNDKIVASTTKEEITVGDTKGDDVRVFVPDMTEPESTETASGREEIEPKEQKGFYLDSGFASLRNPSKALAGREDSYFISHQSWLGVADGVSKWSFEGFNAGVYASELLTNCQKIISDETDQTINPVEVLGRSASETKSPGSSTALVVHFDAHELHIANVGDSGFMVIRNRTVLQKSSPMFHEFGFPLQITQGEDPLTLAEVYHVNLDEGDVIITATDGLFDNLYEKEIASIVSSSLQQNLEPQKIAELLAGKAQEVGSSTSTRTPFADAAQAAGYAGHRGGKLDAVTVIVSLVRTQ